MHGLGRWQRFLWPSLVAVVHVFTPYQGVECPCLVDPTTTTTTKRRDSSSSGNHQSQQQQPQHYFEFIESCNDRPKFGLSRPHVANHAHVCGNRLASHNRLVWSHPIASESMAASQTECRSLCLARCLCHSRPCRETIHHVPRRSVASLDLHGHGRRIHGSPGWMLVGPGSLPTLRSINFGGFACRTLVRLSLAQLAIDWHARAKCVDSLPCLECPIQSSTNQIHNFHHHDKQYE